MFEIAGRYQVVAGSETGHCCFCASVVDTTKPHTHCTDRFHVVCECFEIEDAVQIADALNAKEAQA